MRKLFLFLALFLLLFASCKKKSGSDNKVIVVGATPVPHAGILKCLVKDAEKDGFKLEVREFGDYVTPNEALESGEIDANFFQHIPYMNTFNKDRGFHLVNVQAVHVEPMAVFSGKCKNIKELEKNGVSIAVPNDPANEARALMLLENAGLVTLKKGSGMLATVNDIEDNRFNIKFVEAEAASLPRTLGDVDAAVINGNYALGAGLRIGKDALFAESGKSPYANVVAVKSGNENSDKTKELVRLLRNGKARKYIEETYPDGEVVPVL